MSRTVLLVAFMAVVGCPSAEAKPFHQASTAASLPGDLPSCPGINPAIRRPAGSNCLGILPRQCGADRSRQFIGRRYDQSVRAEIQCAAGDVEIRAFGDSEPVTDDLRPGRLNVVYDSARRIVKVDCY